MRLAALLVLVGCGGGISFEDFAGERTDAQCGYYVRCGAFATVADCRDYYARLAVKDPSLGAAIDDGKVAFDGDAAADCVDAFDHLACDATKQPADALAACADVFTGTGAVGAACAFDGECASDRCVVPDCGMACCQGACAEPRVLPGAGESCAGLCADDLFCGTDWTCHAPLPEGAACDAGSLCASGLYCNRPPSGSGQCVVLPGHGDPCEGPCANVGDTCSDGVCVEAGVGGDACVTPSECSQFYSCSETTSRCELPPRPIESPNGTSCTFGSTCTSHYCDGVCADPPLCI